MGARWIALALTAASLQAAPALNVVLANMDAAAASWNGMRAEVEWIRYTALVDDKLVESGRIAVRKGKDGAIQMLLAFQEPNRYFVSVRGPKVEIYRPRIKTIEEYNASNSMDKLENALLLGFGTAGRYLKQHYEIEITGEETVAGGLAVRLDLQPKNPNAEINNRRTEMWISTASWQPVRQKVYDAGIGDYRLYSYSQVQLNPEFESDDFKFRIERGTKRVRPQR